MRIYFSQTIKFVDVLTATKGTISFIVKSDRFVVSLNHLHPLRGIARRLGVSHNAPYRHFPDKESLLVAIAQIGFIQLHQTIEQASKSSDDAKQNLENIGIAYIKYAIKNQGYYRVMFSDLQLICDKHPELNQKSQQAFSVLLDAVKTGQKAQIFVSEDSLQLANVCWSLTHGVSMLVLDRQIKISSENEVLELARTATKITTKGLRNEG